MRSLFLAFAVVSATLAVTSDADACGRRKCPHHRHRKVCCCPQQPAPCQQQQVQAVSVVQPVQQQQIVVDGPEIIRPAPKTAPVKPPAQDK